MLKNTPKGKTLRSSAHHLRMPDYRKKNPFDLPTQILHHYNKNEDGKGLMDLTGKRFLQISTVCCVSER